MITDDAAGFDEFVAARSAALSRTAYLLTGDHHLAQDLVQAALLQAVKHWRRIHTSPEAYVRRAMYHQNISWWRRRRIAETALVGHDGAVAAADTDLRLTLDQALAPPHPQAAHGAGAALLRGPHRGRDGACARALDQHREVDDPPVAGPAADARARAGRADRSRRMTTQPDRDLRTTLHRLADASAPLPVDDDLWQRGVAARRRGQAFAVAAVLALVVSVGGVATLVSTTDDREARTASSEVVEGGAIPSRIEDIPADLEVGRHRGPRRRPGVGRLRGRNGHAIAITATGRALPALGLGQPTPDRRPLSAQPEREATRIPGRRCGSTSDGRWPRRRRPDQRAAHPHADRRLGSTTSWSPDRGSWSAGQHWLRGAIRPTVGRVPIGCPARWRPMAAITRSSGPRSMTRATVTTSTAPLHYERVRGGSTRLERAWTASSDGGGYPGEGVRGASRPRRATLALATGTSTSSLPTS